MQRIIYARGKSHAVEKLEGTFKARPKRRRAADEDEDEDEDDGDGAAAAAGGAGSRAAATGGSRGAKGARSGAAASASVGPGAGGAGAASAAAGAGAGAGGAAPAAAAPAPAAPPPPSTQPMLPTRTLLVQGLPTDQSEDTCKGMLRVLFAHWPGLVDIRPVPVRGLAFVEFDAESSAIPAQQALHNFALSPTSRLTVTYAR
jgi:hypothetical protein